MNIPSDMNREELISRIKHLIQLEEPITITTHTFPHDFELYLEQIINVFLETIGLEKIKDHVVYFVKELMVNAQKANTKRIYFAEKGLDINNMGDYLKGIMKFKEETFKNREHYLTALEEKGLYILFLIKAGKGHLLIEVINNVCITDIEEKRIRNKIAMGEQYDALEDVLGEVTDNTEGAGLGLIILILMMKKMGVNKRGIEIKKGKEETRIKIKIPL